MYSKKGDKAFSQNKKEEGLNYYQKAIDIYKTIPENSTALNNIALIYMSKYDLGRKESDYDHALNNMDKAVELAPSNSIILSNASNYHAVKAYRDILSHYLNLDVLELSANLDLFSYLYIDQKGKQLFIEKLMQHASDKKSLNYLNKALILSPKNMTHINTLYHKTSFLALNSELKKISEHILKTEIDLNDSEVETQKYRRGEYDKKNIEYYNTQLERMNTLLKKINKDKSPKEHAIIQSYIIRINIELSRYNGDLNVHEMLQEAEKSHALLKSSETRGIYEGALVNKILLMFKQQNEQSNTFFEKYHRIYSSNVLLSLILKTHPDFKKQFLATPEKRLLENLIVQSQKDFPDHPSSLDWFLLKQLDSEYTDYIMKSLQKNNTRKYNHIVYTHLSTNQEINFIYQYIQELIDEKPGNIKKLISEAKEKELVIPEKLMNL